MAWAGLGTGRPAGRPRCLLPSRLAQLADSQQSSHRRVTSWTVEQSPNRRLFFAVASRVEPLSGHVISLQGVYSV